MACPTCGCKTTYQYNGAEFGPDDERMERCAACGEIFDIEDSADEEDELEGSTAASGVSGVDGQTFAPPGTDGSRHG